MALSYDSDLDRVKLNQGTEYLGQRSFRSEGIDRTHTQRHTDTPEQLHNLATKAIGKYWRALKS